jgi:uncharacterized protein (DUF433 family)
MIPMDRIEINPRVCNGMPVIKETRIPVSDILEQIVEWDTWQMERF